MRSSGTKANRIAIIQSNFIPWKGYFDIIATVDKFIFLDNVLYTSNDWRNRNLIKTPHGTNWLTIPVGKQKNKMIEQVRLPLGNWREKHLKSLQLSYGRCLYFREVMSFLHPIYQNPNLNTLSEFNVKLIREISDYLGLKTQFGFASEYATSVERNLRIIEICKLNHCDTYITTEKAKNYIDVELFLRNGLRISWMNYESYREYPQRWGNFEHKVSILDLLFNCGKGAQAFMLAFQES